jgi:hypothetical protein
MMVLFCCVKQQTEVALRHGVAQKEREMCDNETHINTYLTPFLMHMRARQKMEQYMKIFKLAHISAKQQNEYTQSPMLHVQQFEATGAQSWWPLRAHVRRAANALMPSGTNSPAFFALIHLLPPISESNSGSGSLESAAQPHAERHRCVECGGSGVECRTPRPSLRLTDTDTERHGPDRCRRRAGLMVYAVYILQRYTDRRTDPDRIVGLDDDRKKQRYEFCTNMQLLWESVVAHRINEQTFFRICDKRFEYDDDTMPLLIGRVWKDESNEQLGFVLRCAFGGVWAEPTALVTDEVRVSWLRPLMTSLVVRHRHVHVSDIDFWEFIDQLSMNTTL